MRGSCIMTLFTLERKQKIIDKLTCAPLAHRASCLLGLHSFLFGPDGAVIYDYIITNSINSLLIGSKCIPNGEPIWPVHIKNTVI